MRYFSSVAVETTLSAGINASQTSIVVDAVTGFPISYPYTLSLDADNGSKELVEVSAAVGTTLTVTRGVDGTSGVSHTLGAVVRHDHSARDFRETQEHLAATGDVHGVTGLLVGATSTQTLTNKNLTDPSNTFPSNFVLTTATQTLTNKDLSSASNTFPTSLVTLAGTQTLTNKDLTSATNTFPTSLVTLTGTQVLTNKDLTSGTNSFPTSLVTLTGTQTLTNKSLTDPHVQLRGSKADADVARTITYDATEKHLFVKDAAAATAGWSEFSPDITVADKAALDAITTQNTGKTGWVAGENGLYVWNGTAWRQEHGSVATYTDLASYPTRPTGFPVYVADQQTVYYYTGSTWVSDAVPLMYSRNKTSDQTIASSTTDWTLVTWETEDFDQGGAFTYSAGIFTYAGPYKARVKFDGFLEWQQNDTNDRLIRITRSTDGIAAYAQQAVFTERRVVTQGFSSWHYAEPGYKFKVEVRNEHTSSLRLEGSTSGAAIVMSAVRKYP